jgi:hypothetical protein
MSLAEIELVYLVYFFFSKPCRKTHVQAIMLYSCLPVEFDTTKHIMVPELEDDRFHP